MKGRTKDGIIYHTSMKEKTIRFREGHISCITFRDKALFFEACRVLPECTYLEFQERQGFGWYERIRKHVYSDPDQAEEKPEDRPDAEDV